MCGPQNSSTDSAAGRGMARNQVLKLVLSAIAAALFAPFIPAQRRAGAAESVRVAAPQADWDKVEFTYPGASRSLPGIAVRLPQSAGGGLCTVCRICPHAGCPVSYQTDFETVGGIIGKELAHPVFFCRCHFSAFDPAHDGSVLNGPSPRPLWRFQMREDGDELLITGAEAGAGEIG